ncbi:MAG: transposase family protein [Kiritimatiellae bacterium]|nr:transposase family protein [Kiritimatiellia bacterium]
MTRLLAKKLLERAADVSMKSLAEEYRISWRTVRDAWKRCVYNLQ